MNYKVTVDGKEIEYGALVEKSRFSDDQLKEELKSYFELD